MSNLKLWVEVVSAHNLLPKDGQGSCSAFVELHVDGQMIRTTVKEKDIDPVWNETFFFNISNPDGLPNLTLEACVYSSSKSSHSKSSLGKVRITGTSFVPHSDAVVLQYPLEKGNMFSRARGELGLKVFITDDPSIKSSNPLPAMDSSSHINSHSSQSQASSPFLFVRVVKAQDLLSMDVTESLDPYVDLRVGNYKGVTRHLENTQKPVWNAVFAFAKERIQSSVLEVVVKNNDLVADDFIGMLRFDILEIPTRVPPDSPLAPEWYRLENKHGEKMKGEVMLAVWMGTEADEAFPDALPVKLR